MDAEKNGTFWYLSNSRNIVCDYHIFCKEEEVICDFLFAAFTGTFQGVIDVVCEWGSLFVITMENKVNSSNLLF